MSNADVTLIKSLYAAFGRGDIAPIIAALTSDVDWRVNGRQKDYPCLGTWKGPAGVQTFFGLVAENEQASEFTPREFYAAGDKVFVLGHYAWTILKTGRKVAAFHEFNDTAQFAEAYRK